MRTPTPHHQRLQVFAGDWLGQETVASSPWGEGGPATAQIRSRLVLGGFFLEQDYRQQRDGQTTFEVHASFGFDEEQQQFALFWLDSFGFVPRQPAWGQWQDEQTLVFLRHSARGQARHTYRLTGPDRYENRLENSWDGGQTWVELLRGEYRRQP